MHAWHDVKANRVTPEKFLALIEISKGSKNIAYLLGSRHSSHNRKRFEGYVKALEESGIKVNHDIVFDADAFTEQKGFDVINNIAEPILYIVCCICTPIFHIFCCISAPLLSIFNLISAPIYCFMVIVVYHCVNILPKLNGFKLFVSFRNFNVNFHSNYKTNQAKSHKQQRFQKKLKNLSKHLANLLHAHLSFSQSICLR